MVNYAKSTWQEYIASYRYKRFHEIHLCILHNNTPPYIPFTVHKEPCLIFHSCINFHSYHYKISLIAINQHDLETEISVCVFDWSTVYSNQVSCGTDVVKYLLKNSKKLFQITNSGNYPFAFCRVLQSLLCCLTKEYVNLSITTLAKRCRMIFLFLAEEVVAEIENSGNYPSRSISKTPSKAKTIKIIVCLLHRLIETNHLNSQKPKGLHSFRNDFCFNQEKRIQWERNRSKRLKQKFKVELSKTFKKSSLIRF